jgi:hypothetical protein
MTAGFFGGCRSAQGLLERLGDRIPEP